MENKILYILIAIAVWSIPWKGFALWKSARRGDSGWFIFLLLVNTIGIMEIAYLFMFSNKRKVIINQSEHGIQN
ncbi:MAG: Membrane protein [Candidatus Moranbacteria bacterium GW2011_GWA2_39_41]|nr:MAG: Membrane protein [Candidatus Moranbacteria bacterium GW2011_GWA2_39_41]